MSEIQVANMDTVAYHRVMRVFTYQLKTSSGRPIRKATGVRLPDGREVRFTENMTKREVLAQLSGKSGGLGK